MSKPAGKERWSAALCAAALALSARADTSDQIATRVSAEVLSGTSLKSAQRVVPGDVLIYTVEVRNTGRYSVESAIVIEPIPNHTVYLADSAVGPGVEVDYSVDGGRTFDKPENLISPGAAAASARDPSARAARATAGEYTHIRWRLQHRLKPASIAYVRFRAQVK